MAIIADVCTMKHRGKGMALIGIAFSLGFIIGPLIGAGFAAWAKNSTGQWFMYPAVFAFLLAITDLTFFIMYFKETLSQVISKFSNKILHLHIVLLLGETCQKYVKKFT